MPTPESSRTFFVAPDEHFVVEEVDQLFRFGSAGAPFDSRVHVFGIFAKDDHVHALRIRHGRRHAVEVAHRANAGVEVEHLAQRDVERTNAAAHRSGERAFDSDAEIAEGVDRILREPLFELPEGFFARKNFHPRDLALAAKGFFDGRVEHAARRDPDVASSAVTFDERDDGPVGNLKLAAFVGNCFAFGGNCHAAIGIFHAPRDSSQGSNRCTTLKCAAAEPTTLTQSAGWVQHLRGGIVNVSGGVSEKSHL